MADFQTQFRIHDFKYTKPEKRDSVKSHRDLYRKAAPFVFSTPRIAVHDCREGVVGDVEDNHLWQAFLSTQDLRKTLDSLHKQHEKPPDEDVLVKKPDKLLFKLGSLGRKAGEFHYPRGLAVTAEGDIIVADTDNHRIQVFNQCGVHKLTFGKKGTGDGEFNEPTAVALFENEDIAVCDRRNCRIQVFLPSGKFKYSFKTAKEPFSLACDGNFNVIVSTTERTVEIYTRQGKLQYKWNLGSKRGQLAIAWVAASPTRDEVILSDATDQMIKYYTYDGKLLYKFPARASFEGVASHIGGLFVNDMGQLIVPDTLNHTVNLYSERGVWLEQLLQPQDNCGSVQVCAVGPEGHLITVEFTTNGPHCVKIFRYRDCECHRTRPGSSKKRSSKEQL